MNEQKISGRMVAWGLLALAGAWFAKYCWDAKKMLDEVAEEKTEKADEEAKWRRVEVHSQFTVRQGEVVYIESEQMYLTISGVDKNSGLVEITANQRLDDMFTGGQFYLPMVAKGSRTRRVETGDALRKRYIFQLLELELPKTTGDIPEKNECVATLVVIRD